MATIVGVARDGYERFPGGHSRPLCYLPWNVAAAMLAIPVFLGWNRIRLRREAGRAGRAFETGEVALIAGLTLAGVYLAWVLASVIRAAT